MVTERNKLNFLNLGCGSQYHTSWVNLDFKSKSPDVITHNLLQGIPYQNNFFSVVYHSHVLEHFSKSEAVSFMEECYRVLKSGGIIRVAVPDLEMIAKEYLKNLQSVLAHSTPVNEANYEWSVIELYDQTVREESGGEMLNFWKQKELLNAQYIEERMGMEFKKFRKSFEERVHESDKGLSNVINLKHTFRLAYKKVLSLAKNCSVEDKNDVDLIKFRRSGEIHKWMYDKYSLSNLLEVIGFKQTKIVNAFSSQIDNWNEYGLDSIDGKIRKPDSIFVEAIK